MGGVMAWWVNAVQAWCPECGSWIKGWKERISSQKSSSDFHLHASSPHRDTHRETERHTQIVHTLIT